MANSNDTYTKKVKIGFEANEGDLDKIKKDLDDIQMQGILSPEALNDLKYMQSLIKQLKGKQGEIAVKDEEIPEVATEAAAIRKTFGELAAKLKKGAGSLIAGEEVDSLKEGIFTRLDNTLDDIGSFIKRTFEKTLDNLEEMAQYNLAQSKKYNQEAWDNLMSYGLSGAQSYAFTQAKEAIGVSSDEELYQAMMSPALQQRFLDYFQKYEQSYEADMEIAQSIEQFRADWEDFQNDVGREMMDFLQNNKDTIKSILSTLIKILDGILQLVGQVNSLFTTGRTDSQRTSVTLDIIRSGAATTNNTKTTNVKIDNTFNGVGQRDQSWLSNAGQLSYAQLIKALD